jgi:hypothetical protein
VALCANSDGNDKQLHITAGKLLRGPNNAQKLPVKYNTNKQLWMTSTIFTEFLTKMNTPTIVPGKNI